MVNFFNQNTHISFYRIDESKDLNGRNISWRFDLYKYNNSFNWITKKNTSSLS